MEVILIKDIENLGYANDIVNVKPGYANNYLIPQGYAKSATAAAKKVLAENLKQRAHKDAKILADAQDGGRRPEEAALKPPPQAGRACRERPCRVEEEKRFSLKIRKLSYDTSSVGPVAYGLYFGAETGFVRSVPPSR